MQEEKQGNQKIYSHKNAELSDDCFEEIYSIRKENIIKN